MINLENPKFAISRVRIWNVGSIDYIDLDLGQGPAMALYSPNGTGKSTILESVSIIGHLPCLHRYERNSGGERSTLDQMLPTDRYVPDPGFKEYIECVESVFSLKDFQRHGLDYWLTKYATSDPACRYGIVEYYIVDHESGSAANIPCKHRFAIIIHANLNTITKEFSGDMEKITRILSRHEFDNLTNEDLAHQDDRRLADNIMVLYDRDHSVGQGIDHLCRKLAKGRRFLVPTGTREESSGPKFIELQGIDTVSARSVSYINTDLNDFGRGNDLRETPKDLSLDFGQEMFDRLRLQTDENGALSVFKELRDFCKNIVKVEAGNFTDWRVANLSFELQSVVRTIKNGSTNVQVTTNRKDGLGSKPVSHLSAGENEVFFIGLMLLNLATNKNLGNSIVLLDEPDLHIATNSRLQFFREVLKIQGKYGDQLVIASHSTYLHQVLNEEVVIGDSRARAKAAHMVKVIARRWNESDNKTELFASYDRLYLSSLGRTPFPVSGSVGAWILLPIQSFWRWFSPFFYRLSSFATSRIENVDLGVVIFAITMFANIIFFFIFGLGALLNDVVREESWLRKTLLLGISPLEYHEQTRGPLIAGAIFVVMLLLFIFDGWWHRRRKIKEKARMLGRDPF